MARLNGIVKGWISKHTPIAAGSGPASPASERGSKVTSTPTPLRSPQQQQQVAEGGTADGGSRTPRTPRGLSSLAWMKLGSGLKQQQQLAKQDTSCNRWVGFGDFLGGRVDFHLRGRGEEPTNHQSYDNRF
jgi:hypothetical protein